MSFIAGYLLGLSESGGGGASTVLQQLDLEPALAEIEITDGWSVKIKCTKCTDFCFGFSSNPEVSSELSVYPYTERRYYQWFICVYLNGVIQFAFIQTYNVPYIYDYSENDGIKYEKPIMTLQYIISNLTVSDAKFAGVDNRFSPIAKFTATWDSTTRSLSGFDSADDMGRPMGNPVYSESVNGSSSESTISIFPDNGVYTPVFWNSGSSGQFDKRDILFEYFTACFKRLRQMAEEQESENEGGN